MTFNDTPNGSSAYIDSNVFVYHGTGTSDKCRNLLERCESDAVTRVTGIHVLREVTHRLMMIEAVSRGPVTPGNVVTKLKRSPNVIEILADHWTYVQEIIEMGLVIVHVDIADLQTSF